MMDECVMHMIGEPTTEASRDWYDALFEMSQYLDRPISSIWPDMTIVEAAIALGDAARAYKEFRERHDEPAIRVVRGRYVEKETP